MIDENVTFELSLDDKELTEKVSEIVLIVRNLVWDLSDYQKDSILDSIILNIMEEYTEYDFEDKFKRLTGEFLEEHALG